MNSNIQELSLFNNACDDLLNGKYILVDVKINHLLATINEDERVKDIVVTCVENNNFVDLFNLATSNSNFTMPVSESQIVSLTYNLLYRLKNKDIDLYEFLNTYFVCDEGFDVQFNNFANQVIIPFKQAVGNLFIKRHVIVESAEYQNNYYNKIKTTIKHILNNIDSFKLDLNSKEEFKILLTALYSASDKNDKNLVYALMIALDYFTKCNKKVRKMYLALEECFA